ncbi:MAG TPA: DUF4362 domain-containing protein [Paludibacter sp.]|nr:DUF4362 domain-containing protein [Paludibacter sp.]
MKKYICVSLLMLIALIVINGCSSKGQQQTSPNEYPPDKAVQNGDVLNNRAKVFNEEKLVNFIKNVQDGKQDKIRVTGYTIESDAIIQDLKYDGKQIERIEDTTRDKFGSQDITKTTCSKIGEEIVEAGGNKYKQYYLSQCNGISASKISILQSPEPLK